MSREPTSPAAGEVVVYRGTAAERAAHDHATCGEIARRLAALKGFRFAGESDGLSPSRCKRYWVPTSTLVGFAQARALGIFTEHDLFGGVVPHAFIATKCITHPLVDGRAHVPQGWSHEFCRRVSNAVLLGFAAFCVDDAARAGLALLPHGPVRVKRALGIGGHGQTVVTDRQMLADALANTDTDEISRYGIALEQHLTDVTTYSVGQVRVDDLVATYCGTQRATRDNAGELAYGGSELLVARGDFDALLALDHEPAARRAIEQARHYDEAALGCFGLLASRRNYDVAHGVDAAGDACIGVLEQSWRVGGASTAEVEALLAFSDDPALRAVRASSTELYGGNATVPRGATVYFDGTDDRAGRLIKYAMIEAYGHS